MHRMIGGISVQKGKNRGRMVRVFHYRLICITASIGVIAAVKIIRKIGLS